MVTASSYLHAFDAINDLHIKPELCQQAQSVVPLGRIRGQAYEVSLRRRLWMARAIKALLTVLLPCLSGFTMTHWCPGSTGELIRFPLHGVWYSCQIQRGTAARCGIIYAQTTKYLQKG